VGATACVPVDVRIIAATNRNLARMMKKGNSGGSLLPPQRADDLPAAAQGTHDRHPADGGPFHRPPCAAIGQENPRDRRSGPGGPAAVSLARKRAAAGVGDRARVFSSRGAGDRPRGPAAEVAREARARRHRDRNPGRRTVPSRPSRGNSSSRPPEGHSISAAAR